MTNQDLVRFTEIMTGMSENYPGTQLTTNGLRMRFDALKEYRIEQVSQAASTLLKTPRFNFMPTVGDFVAIIDQQTGKLGIDDRAELQVGVVLECLRRFGSSATPQFEDQVTSQLMTGRWSYSQWARHVKEDDLKWWRQEFIRAYKAHAAGMDAGGYFLYGARALKKLAEASVKRLPVQGGAYA